MDNFTILGLVDFFGGILVIAIAVFIIGTVTLIWTLAMNTFKKFPWDYFLIAFISLFIVLGAVWKKILPTMWLQEFKKRKKENGEDGE